MLSSYRLPISFDPEPLASEVLEIESRVQWVDHWADGLAAPGTWTVLPLIAGAGDLEETAATRLAGTVSARSKAILTDMPRVRDVIETFRAVVLRARLMRLKSGAKIGEHRDFAYFGGQRWSFERGRIRVHIPLITDGGVMWNLDGQNIAMAAGEAWYVNVCLRHEVENRGSIDRINLVLEIEVNEWLRNLFPPESNMEKMRGAALRLVEPYLWAAAQSVRRSLPQSKSRSK